MAGEVAENCEEDVDEEVHAAAGDEEDADGWDWKLVSYMYVAGDVWTYRIS